MTNESSNRPPEPDPEFKAHAEKRRDYQLPPWATAGLLVLLVALASVGYLKSSFGPNMDSSKASSAGLDPQDVESRKPTGEFSLIDEHGNAKSFSEYKGQVVILSFWASWCTPCLVELPTFAEIGARFYDKGLRVIPVNVDDAGVGAPFAKEFWAKKKFAFPTYFDADKSLAAKFEVDMLPANFVIDRQGRIVFSGFGANDWSNDQTVEVIENLLEE